VKSPPFISIVIPVWREEPETLQLLVKKIGRVLNSASQWEIVFVSDGCTGHTKKTLSEIVCAHANVRLIDLPRRTGQEHAMLQGLLRAEGDFVCTMDSDLEHLPEELPRLLIPLEQGYELVLGRRCPRRDRSWLSLLGSRAFTALMNARWQMHLSDWGCSYNAGKREVFSPMKRRLIDKQRGPLKRFLIQRAARWKEVPVTRARRYAGNSGYRFWYVCWFAFRMLTQGHTLIKNPLRVFFMRVSVARVISFERTRY
jgi:undecaprenyl-phosphate 4-deoxy-4-formamido-L-arabinose transferase